MTDGFLDQKNVYRPRGRIINLIFAVIWTALIWLLIVSIVNDPLQSGPQAGQIIGLALMIGIDLLFILYIVNVRIITTPEGIEYFGIGYWIRANWIDLVRVERPWWFYLFVRSIQNPDRLLFQRATILGPSWLTNFFRVANSKYIINVGGFDPYWRESKLGDDIRRYAPQLRL
jgi:hypothetical protein